MLEEIDIEEYFSNTMFEVFSWRTHFTYVDDEVKIGLNCLLRFEISMN